MQIAAATPSSPRTSAAPPPPRELAEHLEVDEDEVIEGIESAQAYRTLSLDAPARTPTRAQRLVLDTARRRGRRPDHVELRSRSTAARAAAARGKQILMLRFFQRHDPVADRRGDRRLADARLTPAGAVAGDVAGEGRARLTTSTGPSTGSVDEHLSDLAVEHQREPGQADQPGRSTRPRAPRCRRLTPASTR